MINRILIRIKVIQILYSFLLVEKQFSLERNPSAPTKEKRFAYALYLDMILLMIRIAESIEKRGKDLPLYRSKFISRLLIDETVKALLADRDREFPYAALVESLAEKVKESALYKHYLLDENNDQVNADAELWPNLFRIIILGDPAVQEINRARTNYTLKGLERMSDMMERTFVNFLTSQDNVQEVEQTLAKSLDEARDLYLRLMCMPVELTDLQDRILDDNRHKVLKTDEDINPDMRFVENEMVAELRRNPVIGNYLEGNPGGEKKIPWAQEDPVLFRKLLEAILASDDYAEYMDATFSDMNGDCELWRNLFRHVILENGMFLQALEDKSVFWNDDLDIISTFVLKSFRRIADGRGQEAIYDKYKDEEDARFGRELVRCLYRDKDTYRLYINEALDAIGNWDKDRIAFMDIVIMMTALAEIMNFPKIPLSATMNEYIEIAKSYSSARSGAFVNGILGAVVSRLQAEGKLLKK